MSDTTKSLRPLVNRAPCWESEHEPVITFFTDDGDEWGFPFFGLLAAQYTPRDQTLALQWQGAQVRIQGPRTRDFFIAFAKRERDRHQSERCGYPFGSGDPASLPSPRRLRGR